MTSDAQELDLQRRRLMSIRGQYAGNGVVPANVIQTYDGIRIELEKITGRDFSQYHPRNMRRELTGSIFVTDLYPAIDQLLLLSEPVTVSSTEDKSAARLFAVIDDQTLRQQCADLFELEDNFHRVITIATTVFEDRLRKFAGAPSNLVGVTLVNETIKGDPKGSVIVISEESSEQQGFADLCRGVMGLFRNQHHHRLVEGVTRAQAMKTCLAIDEILRLLDGCTLNSAAPRKWA